MFEFHVPDMSCGHCVAAITQALQALDPEAELQFDKAARTVSVRSRLDAAALVHALQDAGFPPSGARA